MPLHGNTKLFPQFLERSDAVDLSSKTYFLPQIKTLGNILFECRHVKKVDLSNSVFRGICPNDFATFLESCVSVRELDFSNTRFVRETGGKSLVDENCKALARGLYHNSTLAKLSLNNILLTDESGVVFAAALEVNSTLQEFNLMGSQATDTTCYAFATMLITNTTLSSLSLISPHITSKGASAFLSALETNRSLVTLNIKHGLIEKIDKSILILIKEKLARNRKFKLEKEKHVRDIGISEEPKSLVEPMMEMGSKSGAVVIKPINNRGVESEVFVEVREGAGAGVSTQQLVILENPNSRNHEDLLTVGCLAVENKIAADAVAKETEDAHLHNVELKEWIEKVESKDSKEALEIPSMLAQMLKKIEDQTNQIAILTKLQNELIANQNKIHQAESSLTTIRNVTLKASKSNSITISLWKGKEDLQLQMLEEYQEYQLALRQQNMILDDKNTAEVYILIRKSLNTLIEALRIVDSGILDVSANVGDKWNKAADKFSLFLSKFGSLLPGISGFCKIVAMAVKGINENAKATPIANVANFLPDMVEVADVAERIARFICLEDYGNITNLSNDPSKSKVHGLKKALHIATVHDIDTDLKKYVADIIENLLKALLDNNLSAKAYNIRFLAQIGLNREVASIKIPVFSRQRPHCNHDKVLTTDATHEIDELNLRASRRKDANVVNSNLVQRAEVILPNIHRNQSRVGVTPNVQAQLDKIQALYTPGHHSKLLNADKLKLGAHKVAADNERGNNSADERKKGKVRGLKPLTVTRAANGAGAE